MFIKFLQTTVLLVGSALVTAQAAPTLSFNPSSQSFNTGNFAEVDIVISGLEDGGLNEIVSAYDLSVNYDSSILGFSSINIFENPFGFVGGTDSNSSTAGVIDFSLFSFESDSDLQTIQGDSIILATLGFDTLTAGTSLLGFDFVDMTGLNFSPLSVATMGGEISVNDVSTVPLPAAFPLMLSAIGAIGFLGSRRKNLIPQS